MQVGESYLKMDRSEYKLTTLTLLFLLVGGQTRGEVVRVTLDTRTVVNKIDARFVGVTLDDFLLQEGWAGLDLTNKHVLTLARALSPCFLRMGGTAGDALIFDPSAPPIKPFKERPPYTSNFTMNATTWDAIHLFIKTVEWDLIFGLNAALRDVTDWQPSNAIELLHYTAQKGYKVYAFELGNEPDLFWYQYGKLVTSTQLARDFLKLRAVLDSTSYFNNTLIMGPDTSGNNGFFNEFMHTNGTKAINIATYHHYYFDAHFCREEMFRSPDILDSLVHNVQSAVELGRETGRDVWLGETSSASSQGKGGFSDTYIAGFMWMDKLGVAATYGLKAVLRQDFYGGHYALIQSGTLQPNPDYWLTVLYKRLVGGRVLNATVSSDNTVRVYAYCSRSGPLSGYSAGSVTLTVMNLRSQGVNISLPQFPGHTRDLYLLTPRYMDLTSKAVDLNGHPLIYDGGDLPPLEPAPVSQDPLPVPSLTFGFIVLPQAQLEICT